MFRLLRRGLRLVGRCWYVLLTLAATALAFAVTRDVLPVPPVAVVRLPRPVSLRGSVGGTAFWLNGDGPAAGYLWDAARPDRPPVSLGFAAWSVPPSVVGPGFLLTFDYVDRMLRVYTVPDGRPHAVAPMTAEEQRMGQVPVASDAPVMLRYRPEAGGWYRWDVAANTHEPLPWLTETEETGVSHELSPDGRYLRRSLNENASKATLPDDLWDLRERRRVRWLGRPSVPLDYAGDFSKLTPDGPWLIAGRPPGEDWTLVVVPTGEKISLPPLLPLETYTFGGGSVTQLKLARDGRRVVRQWTPAGEVSHDITGKYVTRVEWTASPRWLYLNGYVGQPWWAGQLLPLLKQLPASLAAPLIAKASAREEDYVLDVRTGEVSPLPGNGSRSFTPDGKLVVCLGPPQAAGSSDSNELRVYRLPLRRQFWPPLAAAAMTAAVLLVPRWLWRTARRRRPTLAAARGGP